MILYNKQQVYNTILGYYHFLRLYQSNYWVYAIRPNSLALIIAFLSFFWTRTECWEYFLGLILSNLVIYSCNNGTAFQEISSITSLLLRRSFFFLIILERVYIIKWYRDCRLYLIFLKVSFLLCQKGFFQLSFAYQHTLQILHLLSLHRRNVSTILLRK